MPTCKKDFSVVVPVHNAPAAVDGLLNTLAANSEDELLAEILIGDDASDPLTLKLLQQHAERNPKLRIIRHNTNLGFLRNVNAVFEQTASDRVVLLNSDTMVPPGYLSRIAACLDSDPSIALATPLSTNANNVTIRPPRGQTWRDIDLIASHMPPKYPDAPSAVGCALAIAKPLIRRPNLFDPAYGNGYWEDTDLHFFLTDKGLRSVIIDNLLIYHDNKSVSFAANYDLPSISKKNEAVFRRKWWPQYTEASRCFASADPLGHFRRDGLRCRFELIGHVDVLFVLPGFARGSGGIDVVVRITERLIADGVRAAICVTGKVDWDFAWQHVGFTPFLGREEVLKSVASASDIVATHYSTFAPARALARRLGSRLRYFVQGPEAAFDCGLHASEIAADYQKADDVVVTSDALKRYVKALAGVDAHKVRLGPSQLQFAPTGQARDPLSIAICLRHHSLKGDGDVITNALMAKRAGFRLHLFGNPAFRNAIKGAKWHGHLSQDRVARLLNEVGFFLSCSFVEGLGLLPLEAAFCGAIPIVSHPRGLQRILQDNVNAIALPDQYDNAGFFRELRARAERGEIEPLRDSAASLRNVLCEEFGFNDFVAVLGIRSQRITSPDARIVQSLQPKCSKGDIEQIKRAERLRRSFSWRVGYPGRAAASVLRGRRPDFPQAPRSGEEALALIYTIKNSWSWQATAPIRFLGRKLHHYNSPRGVS